jgi:hypothetical protein
MNTPAWEFWMNARIRAAGTKFENEQRQRQRQTQTSAGAASPGEKEDLVDAQEARADQRERQDGQPSLADQADALGAS